LAEDQETRIRAPPDPLALKVRADNGSFVYRFEDFALSRRRDGFDSHTSYLKENNGMKGNGALRALGARDSRFDSDLPDCPVV
jgi:hypothetical protein